MSAPAKVLVAHGDLLALELDVDGPRTNATAGAPVESSMVVLYGDNRAEIGVRSCTPGAFAGAKDGITEHMLMLASDATITGDDGTSVELRVGVSFVMPDGWTGRWEGRHTLVKQYTIWRTAPTDASA
ncbi:MAG: hypothetical protein JWO74_1075 [Solirubrobacterales bacterium]|jgi:uncharacterized cupin superfamily protein|nr:hypothetical protein [Solirubrobacterales bacterium]